MTTWTSVLLYFTGLLIGDIGGNSHACSALTAVFPEAELIRLHHR